MVDSRLLRRFAKHKIFSGRLLARPRKKNSSIVLELHCTAAIIARQYTPEQKINTIWHYMCYRVPQNAPNNPFATLGEFPHLQRKTIE